VLDVATGTAAVAIALVRAYGCRVTGVDQSSQMLAVGLQRIRQAGMQARVVLHEARAEELPFPTASFDAVAFTFLLRYVDDPGATLQELARVLKPGGRLAGLEFGVPPAPFWRAGWKLYTRAILPAAGRLASRQWYEVGRFLGPSIEEHYRRYPLSQLASLWKAAGVDAVRVRPMSLGGGVVTCGVRAYGRVTSGPTSPGVLCAARW
jgi:demethylmenaquinone methyltransferase/2-methoxy-6-polyprenyl-1,4-benzoquinol methylase